MLLTFDRRSQLQGKPATHGLIVGISRYPNLPMAPLKNSGAMPSPAVQTPAPQPSDSGYGVSDLVPLNFAARSAYTFADWLVENADRLAAPLATCRVMYSPSDTEVADLPQLKDQTSSCDVVEFRTAASEWRRDALDRPENMLIFYFAGHSIELAQLQPALVLADFSSPTGPILYPTVSLSNAMDGLAPSSVQPNIARQQFLFIDTDRVHIDELTTGVSSRTTDVVDPPFASVSQSLNSPRLFPHDRPGTSLLVRTKKT
jgi:hypothetical protein